MKSLFAHLFTVVPSRIRRVLCICLCMALSAFNLWACGQGNGDFERPSKTLGIGVIQLLPHQVLSVFKDPFCRMPIETYEFGNRDGLAQPKFFDYNFDLCYFVCTQRTDDYYKILINPLDEAYIRIDPKLTFWDWDDFLRNDHFAAVGRKDWFHNRMRLRPHDKAPEMDYERHFDALMPLKTQGEWLKVRFTQHNKQKTGWIRWRSKSKLLLNFQLRA